MILVDTNQVLVAGIMHDLKGMKKNESINESLVRHIVLNCLRSYRRMYGQKYGDLVVCCDNSKYWRKDFFPYYKAHRRSAREASGFDWQAIFTFMRKIRTELSEFGPYKVLDVAGAEADDVIAALAIKYAPHESIMIISSDKDFTQLQSKHDGIAQYSPIMQRMVKSSDPLAYMKEHIIRGDRGDGIPNILSSDTTFVSGERQKVINSKNLAQWLKQDPEQFCVNDAMLRGWKRNETLINFDFIPKDIIASIYDRFDNTTTTSKKAFLNYLMENRLGELMKVVDEF